MTKLTPVHKIENYAVIIRATWERGENQAEAIRELRRRGLWLSPEQIVATGLSRDQYDRLYQQKEIPT